jgi:hypothetical protein
LIRHGGFRNLQPEYSFETTQSKTQAYIQGNACVKEMVNRFGFATSEWSSIGG